MEKKTEIRSEEILELIERLYWSIDAIDRVKVKKMIAEADYMMENAL